MPISQGQQANINGKALEVHVSQILTELGCNFKQQVKFTNVYGSNRAKVDFMIDDLAIECKFQKVAGSVSEKMPYAYENLSLFSRGLLVLDGDYFKKHKGIHNYLNNKVSNVFDWCFVDDLAAWIVENILYEQTKSRTAAK